MKWCVFGVFVFGLVLVNVPTSHALHLTFVEASPTSSGGEAFSVAGEAWAKHPEGAATSAHEQRKAPTLQDPIADDEAAKVEREAQSWRDTGILTLLVAGVASMAFVAGRRQPG